MTSAPAGAATTVVNSLHDRISRITGWRRAVLLFAMGAASAAALPPLHLLPLAALGFGVLALSIENHASAKKGRARAFWAAFFFAYGYFVAGMYWTGISFLVDAQRFAALLPLPVLGLPLLLALFPALGVWGVQGWLGQTVNGGRWLLPIRLALGWSVGEQVRSHILTGLPWNLVGYVWTFSDAMIQPAAWIGAQGLSLLTVMLLAAPALLIRVAGRRERLGRERPAAFGAALVIALLFAGFGILGGIRLQDHAGVVDGQRLRIVQANIQQALKWRDDQRSGNVARQIELSLSAGHEAITLWIWPETAVPFFLAKEPELRAQLGALLPPGGVLITGAPRLSEPSGGGRPQFFNSAHALAPDGEIMATYDKRHLVPFGEYLPWRPVLAMLGLDRLAPGAGDFSAGFGPTLMQLPGLGAFRPLICYEGIFADEILPDEIIGPDEAKPGWLLSLSNDGWFGASSGPYQHFAMTRLRAVEQGLPMLRAANTGISGVIDAHGRVVAKLGLNEAGVLDADLPKPLAARPLYAQFGERIFWGIFAALGVLVVVAGRKWG